MSHSPTTPVEKPQGTTLGAHDPSRALLAPPEVWKPARVLVIDDTPAIHEDFRKILAPVEWPRLEEIEARLFGAPAAQSDLTRFVVESAFQGQQGLEMVQRALGEGWPYALAFVDVRMPPGWDGIETIARVWEADPDLQVVIATAYSDYTWSDIVERLGNTDNLLILKKPFDHVAVLQLAHSLVKKWRLQQQSKVRLEELDRLVAERTQDLRASENRLRSIWEHSIDGMRLTDAEGRMVAVNEAFCRLVQMPRAQLVGQVLSVAYDSDGAHGILCEYLRRFQAGDMLPHLTTRARLWNAKALDLDVSNSFVELGDQGRMVLSLFRDTSDRQQAELRLTAFSNLSQRLSAANTAREAAMLIVEVADQLLGWDACVCDLYSASEDAIYNVLSMDIINGRRTECSAATSATYDRRPPAPLARRALQEGGVLLLRESPQSLRADGQPFGDNSRPSASILYVPIRYGQTVTGVLSIQSYKPRAYNPESLETLQALADHCGGALDRIKTEEALRAAQEQLRQSQKLEAIGQLAGGVAHDFNNLLAVIRGNTELVLMEPAQFNPEAAECLKHVAAAADRAANLTRQLLAFSRKQIMQARRLDLNDVVGNLTKMLKRIIGEHIQLQCNYAARLPGIQADVGMLEQVLVNLVVNARDAMPKGGLLVITTEALRLDPAILRAHPEGRAGEFVACAVGDTGTGIAPEHRPHIFEPFFTTKEVGKGTGLGLATVYGIVKQHQGWIEVATHPGAGSTFTFFLPALPETVPAPAHAPADPPPRGGSEAILLVEDDEAVRGLTRRVLENHGYRVHEAASGREVVESWPAQAAHIDLLLTDVIMPQGMTGRELAERLRATHPDLKIIFTSGYSGDVLGKDTEFLSRIKARFLPKPCSPNELLRTVRECLEQN